MKKEKIFTGIYYLILVVVSIYLSIHLLFDQTYYVQLLLGLVMIVSAILLKRFVQSEFVVFFSVLFILFFAYQNAYNRYQMGGQPPLYKEPSQRIADFSSKEVVNYYEDHGFHGFISWDWETTTVYVYDLRKSDLVEIEVGGRFEGAVYHDGHLYITRFQPDDRKYVLLKVDLHNPTGEPLSMGYFYDLQLYPLGDELLAYHQGGIHLVTNLSLVNKGTLNDRPLFAIRYGEYYIFEIHVMDPHGFNPEHYQVIAYDYNFNPVKVILEDSNNMGLSVVDGELYVSVSKNDRNNLYVYDNTLIKKAEYELTAYNQYFDSRQMIQLKKYKDEYYIQSFKREYVYDLNPKVTLKTDKTFSKFQTLLLIEDSMAYDLFITEDHIYAMSHQGLYLLNDHDRVSPTLLSFVPPFHPVLLNLAFFAYPFLCVRLNRRDVELT